MIYLAIVGAFIALAYLAKGSPTAVSKSLPTPIESKAAASVTGVSAEEATSALQAVAKKLRASGMAETKVRALIDPIAPLLLHEKLAEPTETAKVDPAEYKKVVTVLKPDPAPAAAP